MIVASEVQAEWKLGQEEMSLATQLRDAEHQNWLDAVAAKHASEDSLDAASEELEQTLALQSQQQQQREAEQAEQAAKIEADREQAEMMRDREETSIELEARLFLAEHYRLRLQESEQKLEALSVELARSEWYHSRAEVVKRDADHVWGVGQECQEPTAQTVHNLVGLSAEQIRDYAPCVNQTDTSTEDRVALNRLGNTPLKY